MTVFKTLRQRCPWMLVILLSSTLYAEAADIYLSQLGSGVADGSSSINSRSLNWLNLNWGSIQGGDTIRLNGTFTNGITVKASGNPGNPITIFFNPGAKLSAPYIINGFLINYGISNIVVDGGIDGLIESTANGTGLAHTNTSRGVYILDGASYITIQNLSISNMYVRIPGCGEYSPNDLTTESISGASTVGVLVGNCSHITLLNNIIDGAENGITLKCWGYGKTNRDVVVFGNQIYRNCISIVLTGDGGSPYSTLYDLLIVSNRLDHWSAFSAVAPGTGDLHLDGIYLFLAQGLSQNTNQMEIRLAAKNSLSTWATNGTTLMLSNIVGFYNREMAGSWTNGSYTITNDAISKTYSFKTNGLVMFTSANITYPYFFNFGCSAFNCSNGLPYVGFTAFDVGATCTISNVIVSHNYFGPDVLAPGTAKNTTSTMFMTWLTLNTSAQVALDFKVFNNVLVWTNKSDVQSPWNNGFVSCNAWGNSIVANNTILSTAYRHNDGYTYGQGGGIGVSDIAVKVLNNFTCDLLTQIGYDRNSGLTNFNPGFFSDYNVWARPFTSYVNNNNDFFAPPTAPYGNGVGKSWSGWRATTYDGLVFDQHSRTNMPQIEPLTGRPLSGDIVLVGKGTNLTSWGIVNDFYGKPRPEIGAWTIGAFEIPRIATGLPKPTGLNAKTPQ